jgi:adhesin transport system membrane fusion protein
MSDTEFKKLAKEIAGKQRNSSSMLLLLVVTLLVVIFVWASTTELDNVIRGGGKTVSEAKKPACAIFRIWGFENEICQ